MFTDPVKNLRALGLLDNSIVTDLGAGTGYYSIAAGHIAPQGKVYAVEVVKDFLTTIAQKVKEARINNVEIIWGDVEKIGGTKIADGIADAVIASNILFQVQDKIKFIEEVKRILKPNGRVLLVDWQADSAGIYSKTAIAKDKARQMFAERGFALEREIEAGAHHYGMILRKS